MSDRVTWLLPVRNGMPYLSETLASIEAQTYSNWEVLVWDDGSTDGTLDELKQWIPDRLPGRILSGEPLGVGGALARLVEACTTELCARIDADDVNLPDRLEQQVTFLEAHPEVALVGSQMHFINTLGEIQQGLFSMPLEHDDIVHTLLVCNCIAHPSVLFRRSAVLQVGNYQPLPSVEDYDLWLRLAANYKLASLPVPLVRYRVHDKSETQTAIKQNQISDRSNACLYKNSPVLFGCSEHEIKRLKEKQHPLPIAVLYQIAKHLQETQGGQLAARLRSRSLIQTAKHLIPSRDIVSRLVVASLTPSPHAFSKELLSISQSLLLKFPGLQQLLQSLSRDKEQSSEKVQL